MGRVSLEMQQSVRHITLHHHAPACGYIGIRFGCNK